MPPEQHAPQPPQPPDTRQRVNLSTVQRIGSPFLVLFLLLALFGVFGITQDRAASAGEALELTVEYTARTRVQVSHKLVIEVANRLEEPLEDVRVDIDRDYVDAFSNVTFSPPPSEVTPSEYRIDLGTIPGGNSRLISANMTPVSYWRHGGSVAASARARQAVEIEFATFVFP